MNEIPAIGFAGWSGSGKTTLIEKLIFELKGQGLRLAVIKHAGHKLSANEEGKDSGRFIRAGADLVLVASPEQSLNRLLSRIHDVDLVLVEGYKNQAIPQIGIARKAVGKEFTASPDHFIALVSDDKSETAVPCFNLDDVVGIANFILEKTMVKTMKDFTHFNEEGHAKMVDVGEKDVSRRTAVAATRVLVNRETFDLIRSGGMKKGDVLTVAQIAGIMGAKRTPDLIPMCHPVMLDGIDLSLKLDEACCSVEIEAAVSCTGRTGVEMEALTAASTAALTVYDMCKAVQKDIVISDLRLLRKTGGVHGDFQREDD